MAEHYNFPDWTCAEPVCLDIRWEELWAIQAVNSACRKSSSFRFILCVPGLTTRGDKQKCIWTTLEPKCSLETWWPLCWLFHWSVASHLFICRLSPMISSWEVSGCCTGVRTCSLSHISAASPLCELKDSAPLCGWLTFAVFCLLWMRCGRSRDECVLSNSNPTLQDSGEHKSV